MRDTIYRVDAINALLRMDGTKIDKALAMGEIRSIPSADRPQGEWVLVSEVASNLGHKCSNCGEKAKKIVARTALVDNYYCNRAEPITEYTHEEQLSKFCPNCGARMKGADDE